jgi:hypothetical protein
MGGIAVGAWLAAVWAGAGPGAPAEATGPAARPASGAAATVARTPAEEPVYRWMDDQGVLHMSQGLGSVPEQYRGAAVPLGVLTSPPPAARRAEPDPRQRLPLDEALRRARTTFDFLILARRYRTHGFEEQAREAVGRGAAVAATGAEWHAVAASYDALGMAQAAQQARRRAEQAAPVAR